jgi:hypothetical protein
MTEKPIIFSTPMVKAILEGRKNNDAAGDKAKKGRSLYQRHRNHRL